MKLAPKLSILLLLSAIVPTILVGTLSYENGRRTIIKETIEHLTSINIYKSNDLGHGLKPAKTVLRNWPSGR